MHIAPRALPINRSPSAIAVVVALALITAGCSDSIVTTTTEQPANSGAPGAGSGSGTPGAGGSPSTPDTVPPTVVSVYPLANATNVPVTVRPNVTFSEPMQSASLTATTFGISGVAGTVSLSGSTASLTPTNPTPLLPNTTYTATVQGGSVGAKDMAGNPLTSAYAWSFTTGASSASYPCDGFYQPTFQLVNGIDRTPEPTVAVPAKGASFADPTYKTCIVRVSNAAAEGVPTFARIDYSRRQAFNADDSLVLVYAYNGTWHIYDARTLQYIKKVSGPGGDAEPQWHPTDPDTLFYLPNMGGLTINKVNVRTGISAVAANFAGRLPWPSAARVWTQSEGSPSADARYWGFIVQDSNFGFLGLMTYDLQTDTILGTLTNAYQPNNVTMSPSGKYIVAQYSRGDRPVGTDQPGGPIAFTADFRSYKHLRPNGLTAHTDVAVGANGNDIFVGDDHSSGHLYMTDLETGVSTNLFAFWTNLSTYYAGHVSGKAFRRPGWIVASEFGGSTDWFHNKVFLVELAANPRILHLAHHHRASDGEYFSQVHASANRDLTRIVFNSNWEQSGLQYIDTYMIEIPATAVP